jgi:hypothetical protein
LGKTKKTDGRTEILQEQETELSYAANIWREEESHGTLFIMEDSPVEIEVEKDL